MDKLIDFLGIDSAAQHNAAEISHIVEDRIDPIITSFYDSVRQSDMMQPLSADVVRHIQAKQKEHWRALFASRLDQQYFNNASLIGIEHCEIGVDPKWYIATSSRIKSDFSLAILGAPLPFATRSDLVVTLDKYAALDMALALSSYTSVLVD